MQRFLLIASDSGDVYVYPSLEKALRKCEPVDVEAGLWELFDVDGNEWRLSVERTGKRGWLSGPEETVRAHATEVNSRARLEEMVRRAVAATNAGAREWGLDELIEYVASTQSPREA